MAHDLNPNEIDIYHTQGKAAAVRAYRERMGVSIIDGKNAVEQYEKEIDTPTISAYERALRQEGALKLMVAARQGGSTLPSEQLAAQAVMDWDALMNELNLSEEP